MLRMCDSGPRSRRRHRDGERARRRSGVDHERTFDQDIDGWSDPIADRTRRSSGSPWDVHSSPSSGSLLVTTNMAEAGLDGPWQCVATTPGSHTASAAAEVNTSILKVDPFVENGVDFFATPIARRRASKAAVYAVALITVGWETLTAPAVAPADTQSARLRFLVGGTYDGRPTRRSSTTCRWCPSLETPLCVSRCSLRSERSWAAE